MLVPDDGVVLEPLLVPGVGDVPGGYVELEPGAPGVLEPRGCEMPLWLPGEPAALPGVVLEELEPGLELIPDCDPPRPGVPTLPAAAPPCCCMATVRVSDSTICSRRAIRASMEPAPGVVLLKEPLPNVPLVEPAAPLELPRVPEPPTEDDCPKPPLEAEELPGCPGWLEEPIAP